MHPRRPATIPSNAILRSTLLARALACAAAVLAATAAPARGQCGDSGVVTITSSSRSVSVGYQAMQTNALGSWSKSVGSDAPDNGIASQTSYVGAEGMSALASAKTNPGFDDIADSLFLVQFTVTGGNVQCYFGGSIQYQGPVCGFGPSVLFTGPGVFVSSTNGDFGYDGVLTPGSYALGISCIVKDCYRNSSSASITASMVLDPLVPPPPPVIAGPVTNPGNCHQYLVLGPSSWACAKATAEGLGGTLAIINDAAENAWIRSTFPLDGHYLWIGLSDTASEGQFVWVDGSPLTYSNWAPGQPDDYLNTEDYVHLLGDGTWNDLPGDALVRAVVEIPSPLPAVVLGPIVSPANPHHEYWLLEPSCWTDAQAVAESIGGTLAIIENAAENAWIWSTFSPFDGELWIGASDVASEGAFVWTDGSPLTYSNWSAGEPNNYGGIEDYVHVWNGGTWNDLSNGQQFLCSGVVEVGRPAVPCESDITGDGQVDGADLGAVLAEWGNSGEPGDVNGDGLVDGADLGGVLSAWGPCAG